MIVTNLSELSRYVDVNPNFKTAFDFLKNNDLSSLSEDKIVVDAQKVFVIVSNTNLISAEVAKLEAHNKYIDIQLPISGAESFGWADRNKLAHPIADFDCEKDIQFFADQPTNYIRVAPGECIFFFPEDAHAPLIGEGEIRKVIVKIAVEQN